MPTHRLIKSIVISSLGLMLLTPPLLAKPPTDKGKGNPGKENRADRDDQLDIEVVIDLPGLITARISVGDARRIAVDNNFTGYKPLPPGIRKNLARGKPLPPGIAKTRAPSGMLSQLPYYEGYEWEVAGTDLLLILIAGHVIADVLKNVFE